MNTLKGFGAIALLAAIALAVSEATRVDLVVVVATVAIVIMSTLGYLASRKRYRRDRKIADGRGSPRTRPRRGRTALALALVVVVSGVSAAAYGVLQHLAPQAPASAGPTPAVALTVRYRTDTPPTAPVGRPWLEVINTSPDPVALRDVNLRYYFDADRSSAYSANCVQTALRCSNVTEAIEVPASPDPGAERYLRIGFTSDAGTLAPGQSSQGIGLQLYRLDHKELDQTKDRSFDATITHYEPSKRVTAYVGDVLSWGEEPDPRDAPVRGSTTAAPAVTAAPSGVVFDDFHYTGPDDPALAANGWQARTEGGGPGMSHGGWSADGIDFPGDTAAEGGQSLRLQLGTDGTPQGTRQAELVSSHETFLTGTLAARIFFTDQPIAGRNGDHINESLSTISSSPKSPNYSELDYEYMPNGGWGAPGPRLDTTSWRSAKPGDRVTHALNEHLAGWHVVMLTAVNGVVTYSIDGRAVFSSDGKTFPRERMKVHFSSWLVDLPFSTQRTWDMRVNWLYYHSGQAVSVGDVQKAVDGFYASGVNYANTLSS